MERVQFQQEQMLAELKDLVDKKLFSESETKDMFRKRTGFETALVRRVAKKSDFLRYIAYEMGLEQLRKKRAERLKIPRVPVTVSDHSLVKRQFQIFERALNKFKSDADLWIQYIQVAKREGARTLIGKVVARALQLHPNVPALYIIGATHEMENQSPSAARTLLQRGLRLNKESVELWKEYVSMEIMFAEMMRQRWEVLGIGVSEEQREIMEGGIAAAALRHAASEGGVIEGMEEVIRRTEPNTEIFRRLSGELKQVRLSVRGEHAELSRE